MSAWMRLWDWPLLRKRMPASHDNHYLMKQCPHRHRCRSRSKRRVSLRILSTSPPFFTCNVGPLIAGINTGISPNFYDIVCIAVNISARVSTSAPIGTDINKRSTWESSNRTLVWVSMWSAHRPMPWVYLYACRVPLPGTQMKVVISSTKGHRVTARLR